MTTTDTPTLDQALAVALRLSRADRAALIARLALELGATPLPEPPPQTPTLALPAITEGTWSDAIPTRREELHL